MTKDRTILKRRHPKSTTEFNVSSEQTKNGQHWSFPNKNRKVRHQLELPSIISHFGVECRAKSLDLQSTSSLLSTVNLHSPLSTGDDYEFDSRNVRVHACFDA